MQAANGYGGCGGGGYANGYANGSAGQSAQHALPTGKQSFKLSADEYRKAHDLTVEGHDIPAPLQEFESVGFPAAIMDEVQLHSSLPGWAPAALSTLPGTGRGRPLACTRLRGPPNLPAS